MNVVQPSEDKFSVLVIDDDSSIRRLVRMRLQNQGYLILEAESGEEGIKTFEMFHPDLVLVDVLMSGIDGFETCRRICQLPEGATTPVLVLTALNDTQSIEQAFNSGAIDFVTKPIQWTELLHRIRRLLQLKRAEETLRDHRAHLEVQVQQRTAELTEANQALQQEIQVRSNVEAALKRRIELENLITNISTHFININPLKVDEGIQMALSTIGNFATVDRSYVFLFSDNGSWMDNIHEWCAEGIVPQIDLLKSIPTAVFPWLIQKLARLENVYFKDADELPPEAYVEVKFFTRRQSKSVVMVPIVYNSVLAGMLGFDSVCEARSWSNDIVSLLKIVGEIFSHALEHRRTEQTLLHREKQLSEITDAMLDIVIKTGVDGEIEFASPSCWTLLGYQPEALLNKSIYDNVHPDDLLLMKAAIQNDGIAEYRFLHVNGAYVWLEALSNLLFDGNGCVEGMVFAIRDITERKDAERELQDLNRLKTEFLSTAAHELRTPLTSIRGFSEILITRDFQADRQMRYMRLINEQATQLGKIIDDLLDISRLEAKRNLTLVREPVNLATLTRELIQPFIEVAPSHQFQIESQLNDMCVFADPNRISQVIKNLISNAIKYSPNGGAVTITLVSVQAEVQFQIKDHGVGLTQEQQVHIFEKFYRADASNTAISGTGLGLAISKLIIDLHGGRIWLDSEYEVGTSFYFSVPHMYQEAIPA